MVPYHLSTQEIEHLILGTGAHIAILGNHITHPNIDYVWLDDEQATFEAVSWLIHQRAHRRLGFIGVPDNLPPGPRRWAGFTRALALAGLPLDPTLVQIGDLAWKAAPAPCSNCYKSPVHLLLLWPATI